MNMCMALAMLAPTESDLGARSTRAWLGPGQLEHGARSVQGCMGYTGRWASCAGNNSDLFEGDFSLAPWVGELGEDLNGEDPNLRSGSLDIIIIIKRRLRRRVVFCDVETFVNVILFVI